MIVFILEDENLLGLQQTKTQIRSFDMNLRIITIRNCDIGILCDYLLDYEEHFFMVFRAGDHVYQHHFEEIRTWMSDLTGDQAGIADERENCLIPPVVWRASAVVGIRDEVFIQLPFEQYFFHYLYFILSNRWQWKKKRLENYIMCRTKEPRWRKKKSEWEMIYPVLSSAGAGLNVVEPIVTVVICTYNDAEYVSWAIRSVLIQSNSRWELIVVNDGSMDATSNILSNFINDPRVTILETKKNRGKSASLNLALSKARGKWLLELDADDWLSVDCIEWLISERGECDKDLVLIYGAHCEWIERQNKKMIYADVRMPPDLVNKGQLIDNPLPIAPRMYRVSFLKQINGWCVDDPYEGRMYEDIYLLSCCVNRKIRRVEIPLYHRRIRKNSITHREKNKFATWKIWFEEFFK